MTWRRNFERASVTQVGLQKRNLSELVRATLFRSRANTSLFTNTSFRYVPLYLASNFGRLNLRRALRRRPRATAYNSDKTNEERMEEEIGIRDVFETIRRMLINVDQRSLP